MENKIVVEDYSYHFQSLDKCKEKLRGYKYIEKLILLELTIKKNCGEGIKKIFNVIFIS